MKRVNKGVRTALHTMKVPLRLHPRKTNVDSRESEEEEEEWTDQGSIQQKEEKHRIISRHQSRESKFSLQQDVDRLRKRLRQEETVRRALEQALSGHTVAFRRISHNLPRETWELLTEVSALEGEVLKLQEQVLHFRKELYREAANLSSSRRKLEKEEIKGTCLEDSEEKQQPCLVQLFEMSESRNSSDDNGKTRRTRSSPFPSPSQSGGRTSSTTTTTTEESKLKVNDLFKFGLQNSWLGKPPKSRKTSRKSTKEKEEVVEEEGGNSTARVSAELGIVDQRGSPNGVSESIVTCLSRIFMAMRPTVAQGDFSKDPYGIPMRLGREDLGRSYWNSINIDINSIDPSIDPTSLPLYQDLK